MTYVSAFIIAIAAIELLNKLSIVTSVKHILEASRKSLHVVRSNEISEEEKQQLLLNNSWRIFSRTAILTFKIVGLFSGVIGLFWLLTILFSFQFTLIHDKWFILTSTVFAGVYALLRKHILRYEI